MLWIDFKQLKVTYRLAEILTRYGVDLRGSGADRRGRCPLPTHTSPRSRDSFAVNLDKNVWSCRSLSCMEARGGRLGGTVLDFVALMEGCSIRQAAERLQQHAPALPPPLRAWPDPRPPSLLPPNRPLPFTLQHIDGRHPAILARGVTPRTADHFQIGVYRGTGVFHGRLVVPIHNTTGALIAYAGRALNHDEPKYRFPRGFRKSLVLFNLHRALHTARRDIVVVEGFFDTFRVHQAGYPAVVGLMGATLSSAQADLLCAHFHRVILMLDGDAAGRAGTTTSHQALADRIETIPLFLDDHTQPDSLSDAAIGERLDRLLAPPLRTPER